jgi:hypothetical protein
MLNHARSGRTFGSVLNHLMKDEADFSSISSSGALLAMAILQTKGTKASQPANSSCESWGNLPVNT